MVYYYQEFIILLVLSLCSVHQFPAVSTTEHNCGYPVSVLQEYKQESIDRLMACTHVRDLQFCFAPISTLNINSFSFVNQQ